MDIGRDTLLTDITTDRLDQYTIELEREGNSGATINRKISIVSKVLKHAYRREELERMPFIPRQGEPPTRFRWYTEDEQRRILEACRENKHEEFFILMAVLFDTGMRISEALDLTLDNTDFDKNLITLHYGETKNNDARSIPMTKRVVRLLSRVQTNDRYFTMNYNQANEEWVQVRSRIGMGKVMASTRFVTHFVQDCHRRGPICGSSKSWLDTRICLRLSGILTSTRRHSRPT